MFPFHVVLAATAAISPVSQDAADASLVQRVDAAIEAAIEQRRIVGAVVLIKRHGATVYHRAAGMADREAGQPMPPDAVFRLASVTKPIVAVAALRLVEQCRLRLDDPVSGWIPDFAPTLPDGTPAEITVHQLLTHTAGLGNPGAEPGDGIYHRLGVSDGLDRSGISLRENIARLGRAPLLFPPGTAWRYSLATDVLGEVVARAYGGELPAAVEALVTAPLGMSDTHFWAEPSSRLAVPYVDAKPQPRRMSGATTVPLPEGLGFDLVFDPDRAFDADAFPSGGAGMVGTAEDVARLLEAFHGRVGGLLSPATAREARRDHVGVQAGTQGPGWGFGYGGAVLGDPALAQTPQSAGTVQWGGVYGHTWFVDPVQGWTVVILSNTVYEGMSGRFPRDVRDAVYGLKGDGGT